MVYCNSAERWSMIRTRWSRMEDAPRLAEIRRTAWRHAYWGILPPKLLLRLTEGHDEDWWRRRIGARRQALVIELGDEIQGYAWIGPYRGPAQGPTGEIYELYLDPSAQGTGLGRRLFDAAREQLVRAGLDRLVVRSLAQNEVGCRFYRALGGREIGQGASSHHGHWLPEIAFAWG